MIRTVSGDTLDDLIRRTVQMLIKSGQLIRPSRGPALELQGVGLELTNPRARLSRSEARGRIYSSLGELCWYLSGSNATDTITYYVPAYAKEDEDGAIHGGYGPRLLSWDGVNQIDSIVRTLQESQHSRRAVVQLFDHADLSEPHRDIPCTCTLQFLLRNESLHLITYMRSNDAYLGLPHDVFCFTMIQEMVARRLSTNLGHYTHFVGSLHLYESDKERAVSYLREGWQSITAMPEMPLGDQQPAIDRLLAREEDLRGGSDLPLDSTLHPYWADLARLLEVHTRYKSGDRTAIEKLRSEMSSRLYDVYIESKLKRT